MTPGSQQNPSEALYDMAVVGAGIIGLSTALALAGAGLRVLVLDQQQAMHEASWAAAGMLAANDPHNPAEIHALSLYSESLYPAFMARIHELTGRTISIRSTQTLEGLPAGHRMPGKPITAQEIQHLAPGLNTGSLIFSLMDERSLNPRDIVDALPVAVRAADVDLREHTQVLRVESIGASHRLIALQQHESGAKEISFTARHILFATGAWPSPIAHASAIEPRKGQLIAVHLTGAEQTACTLRIPGLYIVPRGDGHYVIGATLENNGFDHSTSEPMLDDLTRRAAALWPPLAHATRTSAWAGLRPMSPDGLPVIGPLSSDDKNPTLWVASGHFRNGILLAPGTAQIMRDLILGHAPAIDLSAFRANRFAATPA